MIAALTRSGGILPICDYAPDQIQPASLDLRLGETAYRMRCSFLPNGEDVRQKMKNYVIDEVDLRREGAFLDVGRPYLIQLEESLDLPEFVAGKANPKSSTGRIDVFTRLITDAGTAFDQVREQYSGMLYAEVSPRTFSVLVRKGSRLSQLRVRRGRPIASDGFMRRLQQEHGLVQSPEAWGF